MLKHVRKNRGLEQAIVCLLCATVASAAANGGERRLRTERSQRLPSPTANFATTRPAPVRSAPVRSAPIRSARASAPVRSALHVAHRNQIASEPSEKERAPAPDNDDPRDVMLPSLKSRLQPIGELTATIAPPGPHDPPNLGEEMAEINPAPAVREWAPIDYRWTASALVHRPLYFEDISLERYGHTLCPLLQPAASAVRFYSSVLILPYKMGVERPCECVYSLGYYRPGSCAPRVIYRPLWSLRGAAYQAAAVTGLSFYIP